MREEGEVRVAPLGFRASSSRLLQASPAASSSANWQSVFTQRCPTLDAALTSFSLVGSWWQARKHIANWWLWIVVNLVYIGEYIYKDLWLTAVLYAGLVVLAILGLRDWRRAARSTQTAACTTLSSGSPAI